jgi:hypothetical protein
LNWSEFGGHIRSHGTDRGGVHCSNQNVRRRPNSNAMPVPSRSAAIARSPRLNGTWGCAPAVSVTGGPMLVRSQLARPRRPDDQSREHPEGPRRLSRDVARLREERKILTSIFVHPSPTGAPTGSPQPGLPGGGGRCRGDDAHEPSRRLPRECADGKRLGDTQERTDPAPALCHAGRCPAQPVLI